MISGVWLEAVCQCRRLSLKVGQDSQQVLDFEDSRHRQAHVVSLARRFAECRPLVQAVCAALAAEIDRLPIPAGTIRSRAGTAWWVYGEMPAGLSRRSPPGAAVKSAAPHRGCCRWRTDGDLYGCWRARHGLRRRMSSMGEEPVIKKSN